MSRFTIYALVSLAWLTQGSTAEARRSYLSDVPNGRAADCIACHVDGDSGPLNAFGDHYAAADGWWAGIYDLDSDGDGETNGLELGDACGLWVPGAVPPRSSGLSNPGLLASVSSQVMPDCGEVVPDAGAPTDASPPRADGSLSPDGGPMATDPLPSDYPSTRVSNACAVSPGARGSVGSSGVGSSAWLPFAFGLVLFVLLGRRRSSRRDSSVAAAAAAAGEAAGGALSHVGRVALGGAELRVAVERHVAASEGAALVGGDAGAAGDWREDSREQDQSAEIPESQCRLRLAHGVRLS